ncbi:MAG: hypothetical protein EA001_01900 [Oscillatoriales cyanobacterium]|nr:MAG: hypothetical protein EA001_01900 [Oscillatoriales cyanobacterium]
MGTITQSFFYPTAYPSLGSWRFISGLDRSRPVDKTLYLNGLFSPGQINDWTMSYLAVPFAQWGEWYSNPANQGQSIPTYNLRGTWRVEPLASTPEPGIAGAGLMALGLWGIRQRSRRSLQSTSRTIDS